MRSVKAHFAGAMRSKAHHKFVVEAVRWLILVRATAERLDKLVMSAMRKYAVVRRTPFCLGFIMRENFYTKAMRR